MAEESEKSRQKEIKHSESVALLNKPCHDTYNELDIDAYRWTFDKITDIRNFRPRALDPDNPTKLKVSKTCGGWSLSFFTSEKYGTDKLNFLCTDKPNLYKRLGTHIAQGAIEKSDGLNGDPNEEGHFEHFEYKDTDFTKKFTIINQLYSE